jgi:hypothetical protein
MKRPSVFVLLTVILALGFAIEARAQIRTPARLNLGDKFRIVFVTSTTRDATSKDIADYDAFVTAAAKAGRLDTYNGQPVTWSAIGTTAKVSAKTRLPETSPALFLPSGQKVAASGKDFWSNDVALVRPIDLDENGRAPGLDSLSNLSGTNTVDGTCAWTGEDAKARDSLYVLYGVRLGESTGEDAGVAYWTEYLPENRPRPAIRSRDVALVSMNKCRLYGVSSELTVPGGK